MQTNPILPLLCIALTTACAPLSSAPQGPAAGAKTVPASAGDNNGTADASSATAIAEVSVRSHMTFLASDAMNGRGSGTRDEWIAAEYLGAQMQRWGIEPIGDNGGYVQLIEVERGETVAPPVLVVGDARYTHGRDVLVQSLSGAQTSGLLHKFTAGGAVPPGSVVLMPAGEEDQGTPVPGAAAILVVETPTVRARWTASRRLPSPPARLLGVPAGAAARPTRVVLDKATYAKVASLPAATPVTVEAQVKPIQKSQTWNAVGRLTGSDPAASSEVILLSAHLDHVGSSAAREGSTGADTIYNGADDDASGSVAVLELAQALARGPRPKRTIVFAFFGSEESGGHGSRYFADRPVVPLSQIVANLQFEMIGRPDAAVPAHTLWLTGYERSNLGPELAKQGAKLVQDPHPEQNFFTRSDNIQFARRGVVAHTVSSFGLHNEYHQPSDEVRHINFAHMTNAIRSMLAPIRWLADSGFKPQWLPGKQP